MFNKSFIIVQFFFSNKSKTTDLSDLKRQHKLENIFSLYDLSSFGQLFMYVKNIAPTKCCLHMFHHHLINMDWKKWIFPHLSNYGVFYIHTEAY